MPHPSDKQLQELEVLMDSLEVDGLMSALATLCNLKAEHTAENWQDRRLSRRWEKLARKFDVLENTIDNPYK